MHQARAQKTHTKLCTSTLCDQVLIGREGQGVRLCCQGTCMFHVEDCGPSFQLLLGRAPACPSRGGVDPEALRGRVGCRCGQGPWHSKGLHCLLPGSTRSMGMLASRCIILQRNPCHPKPAHPAQRGGRQRVVLGQTRSCGPSPQGLSYIKCCYHQCETGSHHSSTARHSPSQNTNLQLGPVTVQHPQQARWVCTGGLCEVSPKQWSQVREKQY